MLPHMADALSPDDLARLRIENERLRAANAKLSGRVAVGSRLRRATTVFLLVLGCGLVAASLLAIWTRASVLNTDRYVKTMAPIARSKAVQKTVADKLDTKITGAIDFAALARDALPDRADVLAPAIEAGAETAIRQQLDRFVASDRFGELWDEANRRAHTRGGGLLTTRKSGRLARQGDTVYLDLSAAVDRIKQALSDRGLTRIADAIPPTVDGKIPLLSSAGFADARRGINLIKGLSVLLPLLALLALAGHVLMSRPRGRGLLRAGLGLVVTGLLLLAAVGIGRSAYLGAIDQNALPRQAAADIFDALIALLRSALRITVIAAVVLAGLSLLTRAPVRRAVEATGPRMRATASRVLADTRTEGLAAHRASIQWGILLLGGLVLVAWDNPTAAVVVIDAALIALAIWVVRALAHSGRGAPG